MALHTRDGGLVMPNAWDGLSALMLADAGFEAIATSSAALATTLGRPDGRHEVTRDEHLEHARLLGRLTGLPVNGDFEDGYGDTPEDVAATVEAAVESGLAGIGIEDTSGRPDHPIRDFDEAVDRIRSAVKTAKGRIVVTGRTDNFLQGRPDLDDTIRRLTAFAEAGADVLYAPFPPDLDALVAIVAAVAPTPVNVLISPADEVLTVAELQKAGVKRISLGPALYTHAMQALDQAIKALVAGDLRTATTGISFERISELLARRTAQPQPIRRTREADSRES
ncbi:isocitrate lyase/phosphoenolpyruvate mutase family protein [Streptomyces sp. MI02-7b]|uniref:isocitrate lyase/PEP mutase family protein n=1 Tax=Streptomyces sp. MI02-7b TaxID=462941 RepID=UPI0029AC792E|nr:isocitrate lyase/phosphoenolpyruvate mutase family protein [Streptomyces sp. MI02-7b]MDX3073966.1 isocitrate lyase/phosphoenolpyruvate mutase family protein [Streptomyces sp. MI02-7b]